MVVTCALVWPAVTHAVTVWSVDEEFSYGFLVPPVSALLVWWRRHAIREQLGSGANSGLVLVLAAVGVYAFGLRADINAISGLAVSPLLLGMVAFLWGWPAARVVAFPIAFLAFGLGLYRGLLDSLGFALQNMTATASGLLAQWLGLDVVRDGLTLRVGSAAFLVAEQCSGLSSLLSLVALASLWAYAVRGPRLARGGLLLAVLPLVVAANTLRVTVVLLVATVFGPEVALGFFHGASSLALFGVALGGLLGIGRVLGCRLPLLDQ
jgi:exosortase